MRYVGDLLIALGVTVCCMTMVVAPLVACQEPPPSTDAGADPDISDCCLGLVLPWFESPQTCLEDHTEYGECRWLTCLGGLVMYRACK